MSRPKREIYTVRWDRWVKRWICPQLNLWTRMANGLATKREFVRILAVRLARRWQHAHRPSQLRVFGKNGRIQFERTYGRDPRRFKG